MVLMQRYKNYVTRLQKLAKFACQFNYMDSKSCKNKSCVTPVGRYAPSPTGRMHLGNLFSALLSWLSVRSRNGRWVLRIEDLDPQRSKEEYAKLIEDDLHWSRLERRRTFRPRSSRPIPAEPARRHIPNLSQQDPRHRIQLPLHMHACRHNSHTSPSSE